MKPTTETVAAMNPRLMAQWWAVQGVRITSEIRKASEVSGSPIPQLPPVVAHGGQQAPASPLIRLLRREDLAPVNTPNFLFRRHHLRCRRSHHRRLRLLQCLRPRP